LGLGDGNIDWNNKIAPGPLEVGFDESFIMAATGDRVPCVYIRGHHVENLDPDDPIEVSYDEPFPDTETGKANPELLKMHPSHGHDMSIVNGISRIGFMRGGVAALWEDETMADVFTQEAVEFLERNHDAGPVFLFFSLHDPHVPRVPHPRFVGKTDLGPRGDVIVQADWCVGEIVATLERLGITENTLVIFTSDNGPVLDDGYQDQAVELNGDHQPWGPFRGGKYSLYEAGTRMPWIVSWPGQVEPGESEAIISQVDFPAVFAALTDQSLSEGDAPDSFNVLDALLGKSTTGRDHVIIQGGNGFALREGNWKYIPPTRGWPRNNQVNIELGNSPTPQLFNLAEDAGERKNLANQRSELVKELQAKVERIRDLGHSRP
jgi:arylsulfatase A-like enzyme